MIETDRGIQLCVCREPCYYCTNDSYRPRWRYPVPILYVLSATHTKINLHF